MELKKVWMSSETRKKPIWVSDGGENIGNCIFNDSFTFDRNISVSFFGIATAKLFNDFGAFG